jgi:hypothetical protein
MRRVLDGTVVVAEAPPRRVSGPIQEDLDHALRLRKVAPKQEAAIRATAGDRRLGSLVAELGVSDETVRATLLTARAADVHGGLPRD